MDPNEACGSKAPEAKRQKSNDESSSSGNAAIDAPNQLPVEVEQTADIFRMDIDCFEESFDYLQLQDLSSVGKTCKRLQRVAGYCFQQNYSGRAICLSYGTKGYLTYDGVEVKHFAPFIQNCLIYESGFKYFVDSRSEFQRLKQIKFINLKIADVNRLKEIPKTKVEVLRMWDCDLGKNFHEFIELYTKLRCLEIFDCTGQFYWLNHKYPTLEYLKLQTKSSIKGVAMILELNPNIRKFATSARMLWDNRDEFLAANIKLDDLAIEMNMPDIKISESTLDLLQELYERGVYKKLQLYVRGFPMKLVSPLSVVNGLVKLLSPDFDALEISAFKNLEELIVRNISSLYNVEILADNLIKLKRIWFEYASIDDIMPFIKKSLDMQKIKVELLYGGVYFNKNTGIIDLRALNRQREQLPDADKITLYVCEDIYLATKWAMKETDFGLIRVRRVDSFDWDDDFQFFSEF